MNFLITGAAGFLGSSLANHLAREGHQVRGIDDLSTGDTNIAEGRVGSGCNGSAADDQVVLRHRRCTLA